MYVDNNWYGQRKILLNYCGIFKDQNIFAGIQHGMLTLDQEHLMGERYFTLIPFLVWNERVKDILVKNNKKNITIIGSPFIYLEHIFKNDNKIIKNDKKGTLIFPAKSTYEYDRQSNYCNLVNYIEDNFEAPYKVSIYYADLNKDLSIFQKKNWSIISFGKRSYEDFLVNTYNEIANSKNIVCTSLNTVFFYSCFLNKKTSLILDKYLKDKINLTVDKNQINNILLYEKLYPGITKNTYSSESLKEIANFELGYKHKKSKEELIKIIKLDNRFLNLIAKLFSIYYDYKHPGLRYD